MELRLVVVIINYKTPALVCDALLSLEKEICFLTDRVVVVDNFSNDDSVKIIGAFIANQNFSSWVEVVDSGVNGGFSAGNNIGIQHFDADYYLLLNSDAYVLEGAVSNLIAAMSSDTRIGVVGPQLEWPNGQQQVSLFRHLTPWNSFLSSAKTGLFTKLFGFFGLEEVAIDVNKHHQVKPDWISFACVLLKKEVIKEVGLMDEGYFMYREDNDYCRRAEEMNWKLSYEPNARVVHLNQGASNNFGVKRLPKFYFQSRSRYFIKFYGRSGLLFANLMWSFGRVISIIREIVQSKPNAFHGTMMKDIWIGFLS